MLKTVKSVNFGMGIYLPEKVLDNEELERRNIVLKSGRLLTAAQISDKIGVERRHIAGEDETVADMGYKATEIAINPKRRGTMHRAPTKIAPTKIAPTKIDLILVSTSHPTTFNVAGEISKRIGRGTMHRALTAEIIDLHAACSGSALMFSYLLENQKKYNGKNILLIAAEKFSNSVIDLTDPDALKLDSSLGQTIFGDGAAAICFRLNKDIVIHYAINKALPDPGGKTDLILMAMGENKFIDPCIVKPVACSTKTNEHPGGYFSQNGPRVFENVINNIPGIIHDCVKNAGFKPAEIDLVVVHSGSKRVVDVLRGKLAPDLPVYSDYTDGNMSSVSLLYSFIKAINDGVIGHGSKVVLCGFGAGSPDLFSSTAVVEIK